MCVCFAVETSLHVLAAFFPALDEAVDVCLV